MKANKQVAVITGAASGIGLALAEVCLQRGFHVVMADNAITALCDKVEQLSNYYTDARVLGVVCDVAKPESLHHLAEQAYENFCHVDWLFNNAGISGYLAPLWELSNEQVRQVMDVNLHGVIHGLQAFLPRMFKQGHRSRVVNMASFYGLCSGSQMAAYAMSKHAIVALSESLFFDLKHHGKPVDVSVVCPSFTNTRLLINSAPLKGKNKLHHKLSELIGRSRPPEDVAKHIVQEIENNIFYILPDKEVKYYCEQRTQAIVGQTEPHEHSVEKIIATLNKRIMANY